MNNPKRGRGRPRKEPAFPIGNINSEREEFIIAVSELHGRLKEALKIISKTDGITVEDINYNVDIVTRILKNKFKTIK